VCEWARSKREREEQARARNVCEWARSKREREEQARARNMWYVEQARACGAKV